MNLTYKNRPVEVELEFEFGEGCYVIGGTYLDGKQEELTESECMDIEQAYQEDLYQEAYENLACSAYDRAKAAKWDD